MVHMEMVHGDVDHGGWASTPGPRRATAIRNSKGGTGHASQLGPFQPSARPCPRGLSLMPPLLLIRCAIAAVWLYEGFYCKVLGRMPEQRRIVEAVPLLGPSAPALLRALGVVETLLALWVLSGWQPFWAALIQTLLLVGMNTNGLLFARRLIHDPAGMVVKNFVFVVLIWVAAAQGGG